MFSDSDYCYGDAHIRLTKSAGMAIKSYSLRGRLIKSKSGWGILTVPNSLVRGAFDALHEVGSELPTKDGKFDAHISVFGPDEIKQLGDKITEFGHSFSYSLGPVREVEPEGWDEISKCWFIEVTSPELSNLRKSYGLPPYCKHPFHITIAVRRKKVLHDNDIKKLAFKIDPLSEYCMDPDWDEYDRNLIPKF